jgi:hypothetical protein
VTFTDTTTCGEIRYRQTAMLSVNLSESGGDYSMNLRVLEPIDEKALEHVDALRGCVFRRVDRDEFAKWLAPAQIDPPIHHQMRGNPAQHERNARAKSYADQRRRCCESSFIWSKQRTAQKPFGTSAFLQLDGNSCCAVRHNADCCVTLRRDNPEAPDVAS